MQKILEIADPSFNIYCRTIDSSNGSSPEILMKHDGSPNEISFQSLKIPWRKRTVSEIHYHCCSELIFPYSGDLLLAVARSKDHVPTAEDVKIFRIPEHMPVLVNPGISHCHPFSLAGQEAEVFFGQIKNCDYITTIIEPAIHIF